MLGDDVSLIAPPEADGVAPAATKTAEAQKPTDWWAEARGILWLVLAVLGFHSFIAKPFYIPSESMMPGLLIGDRLVVTKFPYGYSFVTPTFHLLPFINGRLFGRLPERGDVVILSPPGSSEDYIKRVIGLPGETLEVRGGAVFINGTPIKRGPLHDGVLPVDTNAQCLSEIYGINARRPGPGGKLQCHVPIVTETLPNGRQYDTIDLTPNSPGDNYGPVTIPANHVFLMGDNRDQSADSRFAAGEPEKGLGGPVPWENLGGRAEFISFSFDGGGSWNPLTWWGSLRPGRAATSLHAKRVPVN